MHRFYRFYRFHRFHRFSLLVCALALTAASSLHALPRYQSWAQRGGQSVLTAGMLSTTPVQQSCPGASVYVYLPGTSTQAPIFSDLAGTLPLAQPITADSTAYYGFHVASGRYDLAFSGGGCASYRLPNVIILDGSTSSGSYVNITDYNAACDGKFVPDAVISASSTALSSATASFTAADVGKRLAVFGAGAAGASLNTTIASFVSSTQVVLTLAATTSVSGVNAYWGTDDTAAIQAALTAVGSTGIGTEVRFPRGVCVISDTLVIPFPRRIKLLGVAGGIGSTSGSVLFEANSNKTFIDASTTITNTFGVENIYFQGTGKLAGTGDGLLIGLNSANAFDSRIERNWFAAIPNAAIRGKNMQGYHIVNNGIETSAYGILCDSCSDNVISDNRFYSHTYAGIEIDLGEHNTIVGNHIDYCGGNVAGRGGIFLNNAAGVEQRSSLISSNNFAHNSNDILLTGSGAAPSAHTGINGVLVTANVSDFANRSFLVVTGASQVRVIGNLINDCSQVGNVTAPAIYFTGTSTSNYLVDNTVTAGNVSISPTYGLQTDAAASAQIGVNNFAGGLGAVNIAGTIVGISAYGNLTLNGSFTAIGSLTAQGAAPTVAVNQVGLGSIATTTIGAAGPASALPATPLAYWSINLNGTAVKIPVYNP